MDVNHEFVLDQTNFHELNPKQIILLDVDRGVEQYSTQWSHGLT